MTYTPSFTEGLTRRRFLTGSAGLAAATALGPLVGRASAAPTGNKKMNVLMIAVDDLRPELGCYGASHIHSPNIDRLAARGMVFNRAYCQQAVCSPSRTSLMTGCRPDTTRVYNLEDHFRQFIPDVVTLPQHFISHGYQAVGMGKIYHIPELNDDPSWTKWVKTGGVRYSNPEDREYEQRRKREGEAMELPRWQLAAHWRGPATEAGDVSDDDYHDGHIANAAVESLADFKQQGTPFFLAVGFHKPHLPFTCPKRYWDLYDRDQIDLAPNPFRPKGAPDVAMSNFGELRNYRDMPKGDAPITDDIARRLIHGYYACISYTDALIGRVLDALDEQGLADNTVIVLWGDHGWQLGEHGMWCKHTNFELATRSPMILSVPGMTKAGQTTDALSEFVDIYPTLTEACGLPLPDGLEGSSALPLLDNPDRPWKPAAFSQYPRHPQEGRAMGYSMRTDRYRYTQWQLRDNPAQVIAVELYDHQTDPAENTNIAEDPEQKQVIAQLAQQLAAGWQAALPRG